MEIIFGEIFIITAALSLVLTMFTKKIALRTGFVDRPGERKIHTEPKPYGGGIAVFLSLGAIIALGYFFADYFPAMKPHLEGMKSHGVLTKLFAIFGGGLAIFALGLADDIKKLSAYTKLFSQLAIATAVVFIGGIRLSLFVDAEWIGALLTIGWIVILTNAFNLLDNMDGLSAGIGMVAAFLFFVVAFQNGQIFVSAILAAFGGALAGFLAFNFPPAKIFLGDSGSLFIGYMLSTLTVISTYFRYSENSNVLAIAMPILILALPIYDTASVIWLRLKNKKPIMVGDKNHFSHRIKSLGFSVRETVLTIYLVSLCLGLAAVLLNRLDLFGSILLLLQCMGILVVLAVLERLPLRVREKVAENE